MPVGQEATAGTRTVSHHRRNVVGVIVRRQVDQLSHALRAVTGLDH